VYESVAAPGYASRFDWYVLSDTPDPSIWIAEEKCFIRLRKEAGADRLFYRHRPENTARKSGNIEDWVRRFGASYDHMIILDADSLMTGDTIVRLAAAMERHPNVALIQTLPIVVNARTLFARLQQFAGRLYGPLIAAGITWWHGSEAIIGGIMQSSVCAHLRKTQDSPNYMAASHLAGIFSATILLKRRLGGAGDGPYKWRPRWAAASKNARRRF